MGLFSGSTKTYVASTVYNMAGDTENQPKVLRSIIISHALSGSKESLGSHLPKALLNSTGIQQTRFFQWARDNYSLGMPTAVVDGSSTVDTDPLMGTLRALIGVPEGKTLRVLSAVLDRADIDYWARIWVMSNYPQALDEEWSADWDGSNNLIKIDVSLLDPGNPEHVLPAPADLLWGVAEGWTNRKLFFCTYQLISERDAKGFVKVSSPALFSYRMGTGNPALDALANNKADMAEFYPAIPLRLDNVSIRDGSMTETYEAAKTAYKKMTRNKIDDLLDQVEENENLDDIDFCFIVNGIALNTKDSDAQRYLYEFMQSLMPQQKSSKSDFAAYKAYRLSMARQTISLDRWVRENTERGYGGYGPGFGQPAVTARATSEPTVSELRICAEKLPSFDMRLRWIYIGEEQFAGNGKTHDGNLSRGKMKKGEFWITVAPDVSLPSVPRNQYQGDRGTSIYSAVTYSRIWMFHQHSTYAYSRLEIVGMEHQNFVYNGHAVRITAKDALTETEDTSGFLVPLHYPTLKKLGLLRGTQISTVSSHLVLNSYQLVKLKWYQTGFFKILLTIVGAVLSVVIPPASVGFASAGILGTNLAVGTALGITTALSAAIAGAVANAIAAMVLTTLIQKASTKLFGEKIGSIFGTILTFVAFSYGKQFAMEGNFNVDWGKLLRIDNLTNLTQAVGGAYTAWLRADTLDILDQVKNLDKEYESKFDVVKDKVDEILGMTSGEIDPMMFTSSIEDFRERPEAFLTRTTMTGSDLAELSQVLIYEFTEMSLELPTLAV